MAWGGDEGGLERGRARFDCVPAEAAQGRVGVAPWVRCGTWCASRNAARVSPAPLPAGMEEQLHPLRRVRLLVLGFGEGWGTALTAVRGVCGFTWFAGARCVGFR